MKRYNVEANFDDFDILEEADGEYVKYEDVQVLRQHNEQLYKHNCALKAALKLSDLSVEKVKMLRAVYEAARLFAKAVTSDMTSYSGVELEQSIAAVKASEDRP